MKGFFKGLLAVLFVLTVLVTAGAALFLISFKKDFEDIERRTRDIVAKIESNQV